MKRFSSGLVLILLALAGVAATPPAGFADALVLGGLTNPTAMAFAPDGRLFVCEQGGAARIIKNGAFTAANFHSFTVDSAGERGLLGVAFDPDFGANGFVYFYYTAVVSPRRNRVVRLTAAGDVSTGGETLIKEFDALSSATNHNGGAIHFGPDGKLYVALGDNANSANAQPLTTRLGKILRLNPDGSIPADNPFYATAAGENRAIWARGLRNPFTFAFEPNSGRMYINDVGEGTWEEINEGVAGANYNWPATEGEFTPPASNPNQLTSPLFAYPHGGATPSGCAITGGTFYNPAVVQFPASYVGRYFFADYCSNWIYTYDAGGDAIAPFATNAGAPVDLDVAPDGTLYYLARGSGEVRRIRYTAVVSQAIVASTSTLTVNEQGAGVVFNARLATAPAANVIVNVAASIGDASISATPPTLTFTPANFATPQNVTVTAADDADTSNDGGTVSLESAGLDPQIVVVTAFDNDDPGGSPLARITKPLNAQIVGGATAELFGDGVDADGTTQAQFFVDGALLFTDINPSGHYHANGGHAAWNTTALANGAHVLRMTVTDGTGAAGSHEITVYVNNATSGGGSHGGGRCGALGLDGLIAAAALAYLGRRRRR
jgi:glucose/arabinose dehydrogenase